MEIVSYKFEDDGSIPNNKLPLLIYQDALDLGVRNPADSIESQFSDRGWGRFWRNGIYTFHHYHSTSHEVLACYQGRADVLLGGEKGELLTIRAGDAVLVPAGVGHFNKGSSPDFRVIGGYPKGFTWDMQYGCPGERLKVLENISSLPIPPQDPVTGSSGGLKELWI